jgi:hypothetical protein
MDILAAVITVFVLVLIAAFALALVSMARLPLGERPVTRTYDRLGRYIGRTENPDFHVNPGEDPSQDPDVVRTRTPPNTTA